MSSSEGSSPHTRGTLLPPTRHASGDRDHPRIRGEHGDGGEAVGRGVGIIPAYAGNTAAVLLSSAAVLGSSPHTRGTRWRRTRPVRAHRDHPRIRGEHASGHREGRAARGIIPAYAGNTVLTATNSPVSTGSSPHTRGTRCWGVAPFGLA